MAPGLYRRDPLSHVDRITIASTGGPEQTEIRSASGFTTFHDFIPNGSFNGPSYLAGFTVTGADQSWPNSSGVATHEGGLTIQDCVIRDNGEGVFVFADAVLERCTISGNG